MVQLPEITQRLWAMKDEHESPYVAYPLEENMYFHFFPIYEDATAILVL